MLEWDLNWPISRKSLFSLSLSLSLSPVFLVLCVAETVVPGSQTRRQAEETERSFTEEGDLIISGGEIVGAARDLEIPVLEAVLAALCVLFSRSRRISYFFLLEVWRDFL